MSVKDDRIEKIKRHIAEYPDFPKTGVLFRDIFSVLGNPDVFRLLTDVLVERARSLGAEAIVALDSRGFLLGTPIALELNVPFYPVRKAGKLPGKIVSASYELEYGTDVFEIQEGALERGTKVLIVDDLIATGGSMAAACELVERSGAAVAGCLVVMELTGLSGRGKIKHPLNALIQY